MIDFDQIAERHILDAIERGELSELPGQGEPLLLEDDSNVPAELRMAYRILRRAGCVPPEVSLRNEIAELEGIVWRGEESAGNGYKKLALLRTKLAAMSGGTRSVALEADYQSQLIDKLTE